MNMKRIAILMLSALLFVMAVPAISEASSVTDTATLESKYADYTPEELLQQWYEIATLLRTDGLYPFVDLEKGDVGFEVQALQTRLKELGYYTKEIVTNFGPGTYNAMRSFEKTNSLKVNGKASAADQKVLFSAAAIAYAKKSASASTTGSQSDAVSGATSDTP
jgi:hypothetical protein